MSKNTGKVVQVIGPVVDVSFADAQTLPNIYDSLVIKKEDGSELVLECQKHIGESAVRAIAMDATDGLSRGTEVINTGSPIIMPVGDKIKGRLFNVTGDTIDGIGQFVKRWWLRYSPRST